MRIWKNLESRNWINNGNVSIPMDGLPPKSRVRSLMCTFSITGTKTSTDALSGDLLAQFVQNIKLANFYNLGGLETFRMRHIQNGRNVEDPTAIPGTGTTFTAYFQLELAFRLPKSKAEDDGSLPTEMLMGKILEITFASATVHGVGTLTATGGTVRVLAEIVSETNTPQLVRYGYVDQASSTIRLDAGVYGEVALVKTDGTTIASTDIGTVDIYVDGEPVLQNVRFEQLISEWNRSAATAAGSRAELAQAGALFVPFCWYDRYGKGSTLKQWAAEKDITIQITSGTLVTGRLIYQKTVLKTAADIAEAARLTGLPENAKTYEPATASKSPLQTDGGPPTKKQRIANAALPGKFRV